MTQEQEQIAPDATTTTSGLAGPRRKTEASSALDAIAAAENTFQQNEVRCIHGARDQKLPIAGKTVGEVRNNLQEHFNFAKDATALVFGQAVDNNYVLQQSDVLEFLREAGAKGGVV